MKNLFSICIITLIIISCKEKETEKKIENTQTVAEKIAQAHGYDQWKHVKEIAFTFNGARHWQWFPKTNEVRFTKDTVQVSYNRTQVDSLSMKIDRAFINDKFWLLIPFQLVWDKSASISEPEKTLAPIGNIDLNKISLTYPAEGGGYTPGDAYDIYYDDDFIIKEWAFRRGNQKEPSLLNTFENYKDYKGIKIAMDHKKGEGDWNLKFTDIEVILD